jgi:hypothetical protein
MKSLLTPNPSLRKEGSYESNQEFHPLCVAERVDQRSEVGVS